MSEEKEQKGGGKKKTTKRKPQTRKKPTSSKKTSKSNKTRSKAKKTKNTPTSKKVTRKKSVAPKKKKRVIAPKVSFSGSEHNGVIFNLSEDSRAKDSAISYCKEKGRYQQIIKALSAWNKSKPKDKRLSRKSLYDIYRKIKLKYEFVSTKEIVKNIGKYAGLKDVRIGNFSSLKLDFFPYYYLDNYLFDSKASRYFFPNDRIVIRLKNERANFGTSTHPTSIIMCYTDAYAMLYNTIKSDYELMEHIKECTRYTNYPPILDFNEDKSNINLGIFVWDLICEDYSGYFQPTGILPVSEEKVSETEEKEVDEATERAKAEAEKAKAEAEKAKSEEAKAETIRDTIKSLREDVNNGLIDKETYGMLVRDLIKKMDKGGIV